MSAAERASKASSAEQANERTDKRVAHYLRSQFLVVLDHSAKVAEVGSGLTSMSSRGNLEEKDAAFVAKNRILCFGEMDRAHEVSRVV